MQTSFNPKGKKWLVYDYGLSLVHALRLAKDGGIVRYFTPWAAGFPKFENYAAGLGYEKEGLEKVMYFWEHIDWADCIVFFDIGAGDMADYLRKTTGKPVFGAGIGERIENHRLLMRKMQKKIGVPMQNTEQVTGVDALRDYLKTHKNKYVKLDIFRGDVESFQAENLDKVEEYLNEIKVALGPFNESYDFMVEDFVEGVEPGFDLFFNGKDWIKPYLWGIEQSKSSYLGRYVDQMPKPLQFIADKLKPFLQKIDYRGPLSTEIRLTKDGTPYLIDVCARLPFPLSAAYTYSINNYSEVVWKIARGEEVQLNVKAKYIAATPFSTKHADSHYVRLTFDEKYKDFIKTRISAKLKDKYYAVKGMDVVFVIVDARDDYNALFKNTEFMSKKIDAFGLDTDGISSLFKIKDTLKKYEEYGLGIF